MFISVKGKWKMKLLKRKHIAGMLLPSQSPHFLCPCPILKSLRRRLGGHELIWIWKWYEGEFWQCTPVSIRLDGGLYSFSTWTNESNWVQFNHQSFFLLIHYLLLKLTGKRDENIHKWINKKRFHLNLKWVCLCMSEMNI